MNESKSMLPDLKELGAFSKKLVLDLKKSITEIMTEYKKNREEPTQSAQAKPAETKKKTTTTTKTEKKQDKPPAP